MNFVAPCLFGIEGLLADELKALGAEKVLAENGRVLFSGNDDILARACIGSRFAERILLLLGSFHAATFTELFDGVFALPFERYIDKRDAFPVKGWSLNSALHSIPDCQKIIKKAAVQRLRQSYNTDWFEESGVTKQLQFSILKDNVTVMLDCTGEGLHRRGYRAVGNAAPIKETLAAAMAAVARIYPDTQLYDPCCGSGTILIEAAMMANNIAPGLRRGFAAEGYSFVDPLAFRHERERASAQIIHNTDFHAHGSDIDGVALEQLNKNAALAGVAHSIDVKQADLRDFTPADDRFLLITNPPYGERLLDIQAAEELYKVMGQRFVRERGHKYYIITPDEQFESLFGRPADRRRKLYNGMIKCQLYMYFRA